MRVHQVMVGASPGDAVTGIALAIDDLLAPIVPTALWALHLDHRCQPRIRHLAEMPEGTEASPDDVVIYHGSIGEPRVAEMMLRRPERLVLYYHNITPARFFEDIDPDFARLLATGHDEIRALANRAVLVMAASSFSAAEITAVSTTPVRVTPPPVDHASLTRLEAHEPTMRHFREAVEVPVILHVGQLLPHKRPDKLIAAMHVLTVDLAVPAMLVFVGPQRNARYTWALKNYVEDLALQNVWMAGERHPEELAAYFRSASVFATASEHEGFCVPVLEAFEFGLPVVACDVAALPETTGAGGVLLPADAGAALFAEAFARVIDDDALRAELIRGGREQADLLSVERSSATLLSALAEVLVA